VTLVERLVSVRPVSPVWTVRTGDYSSLYAQVTHTCMRSGKFNVDVKVDVTVNVDVKVHINIVIKVIVMVVLYLLLSS